MGYAVAFWVFAVVGAPVMTGAWFLLPLASLEEATEQPKALAAGTTMAGTTLVMGVLPLILAHIIGFVVLCAVGGAGRVSRRVGVVWGAVAVVVASVIGLAVVWVLSGGELIYTFEYVP
ncbi:hypothetical protein GCM10009862_25940 [Microbacterium binotii]|uniref:DUF4190 domain-containing protein n=1 Tax=Microbacterium binotii TaxID=462710 RepID=A0ABN3PK44_9MICO